MFLNTLEKNDIATILSVNADKSLKSRFNSFGIIKGAKVFISTTTIGGETIEITINKTKIALRISEASKIEIEKC